MIVVEIIGQFQIFTVTNMEKDCGESDGLPQMKDMLAAMEREQKKLDEGLKQ